MDRKVAVAGVGAVMLMAAAMNPPQANIRILTHDVADTAPHKIEAAVDFGIAAMSLLITWTTRSIQAR